MVGGECYKDCKILGLLEDRELGRSIFDNLKTAKNPVQVRYKQSEMGNTVTVLESADDLDKYPGICRFRAVVEGDEERSTIEYIESIVKEERERRKRT